MDRKEILVLVEYGDVYGALDKMLAGEGPEEKALVPSGIQRVWLTRRISTVNHGIISIRNQRSKKEAPKID